MSENENNENGVITQPKPIEEMTDHELLVELVTTVRGLAAAFAEVQSQGMGGIMKMMMGGKK